MGFFKRVRKAAKKATRTVGSAARTTMKVTKTVGRAVDPTASKSLVGKVATRVPGLALPLAMATGGLALKNEALRNAAIRDAQVGAAVGGAIVTGNVIGAVKAGTGAMFPAPNLEEAAQEAESMEEAPPAPTARLANEMANNNVVETMERVAVSDTAEPKKAVSFVDWLSSFFGWR